MPILLVYVTHPSKPEAIRITSELLNNRIIGCANYFPIESMYWWDGRLCHSDEVVTIYKTLPENWERLKEAIMKTHKNETPCIMKMGLVEANEKYENWIQSEVIIPKN